MNEIAIPITGNAGNYVYRVTTAGTSGGSAPTWPQTVNSTVTDGGVTWTNIGKPRGDVFVVKLQ